MFFKHSLDSSESYKASFSLLPLMYSVEVVLLFPVCLTGWLAGWLSLSFLVPQQRYVYLSTIRTLAVLGRQRSSKSVAIVSQTILCPPE